MEIKHFFIYLSGILTTISILTSILAFYYFNKVKDLKIELNNITNNLNQKITTLNEKINTRKKKAVIIWDNWSTTQNKNNKWMATFTLIQKSIAVDNSNIVQFEIESINASNKNFNTKQYKDFYIESFYETFPDGWVNLNNINNSNIKFKWITNKDKQELRNDKILDILKEE
jgi:hypothetical protein